MTRQLPLGVSVIDCQVSVSIENASGRQTTKKSANNA